MTDWGKKVHDLFFKALSQSPSGNSLASRIVATFKQSQRGGDIYDALITDAAGTGIAADIAAIQTDVGDPSARTNSQDLENMLGNPDTANCTVYGAIGDEYVNTDGIPEVDNIRAHMYKTGFIGGGKISRTVTFSNDAGPITVFTTTGDVRVEIIAVCTTDVTSAAVADIEMGIAADTDAILPTTVSTDIDAREIWHDAMPDSEIEISGVARKYDITDGNDIIMTLSAQVDAGEIIFYCYWTPHSSDGDVVVPP